MASFHASHDTDTKLCFSKRLLLKEAPEGRVTSRCVRQHFSYSKPHGRGDEALHDPQTSSKKYDILSLTNQDSDILETVA